MVRGGEILLKKGLRDMKIKLYNCIGTEHSVSEYSIGLGYLKTNCTGADIEIVTNRDQLKDCDLIGLSACAEGVKEAVDIMYSVPKIPTMIGGQCTLWKGLYEHPFAYIVRGEGERALQCIIDHGERMWGFHHNLQRKNNLVEFYNCPNLDDLNFPDRGRCAEIVPILTSRGCPYNCNFCSSQKYWGKPRYVSAGYFMDEVAYLVAKYEDMKHLYILDDLFMSDKKRFEEIYERWMVAPYKMFSTGGFVRSNLITKETAQMLKDMGWQMVRFGAESGSNRILKMLNKQATVEDNQRCIDICLEIGLSVSFAMMWYVPGETVEDRRLTGEFLQKNVANNPNVSIAGTYQFRPYPGTKFYNGESLLEGEWNTRGAA